MMTVLIGVDPHKGSHTTVAIDFQRLSHRGNRQLNHALHMAAVTQIRFAHSPGRGYYDAKLAQGKTKKKALRALNRRLPTAHRRRSSPAVTFGLIRAREDKRERLLPAWPTPHP